MTSEIHGHKPNKNVDTNSMQKTTLYKKFHSNEKVPLEKSRNIEEEEKDWKKKYLGLT